ncbi:MAG TPA: hypothetical protein VKZ96_06290, partial [Thermomicrobiales bacterium]|nr:hypothetical protein [Thermomicrobiales bacterium]
DDLLEGGGGNDTLTDKSGKAWFNGGAGSDKMTGGSSAEIFAGGVGNDTIYAGGGADVILYNAGDGSDVIYGGAGEDNTLSLGGGVRYEDLQLRKSSKDLILEVGCGRLTFKDWYSNSGERRSVANLQVIVEASGEYDPTSSNALLDDKIEQFDFAGLVSAFDQARAADSSLTSWALTNALTAYYLSATSGDMAALGGDLAYYYGKTGSVAGMSVSVAQDVVRSAALGVENQSLGAFPSIPGATATLS